jgi:hypothetical protein
MGIAIENGLNLFNIRFIMRKKGFWDKWKNEGDLWETGSVIECNDM